MKHTGAIFEEPPVTSGKGDRFTNSVCSRNSDSNYTIDGKEITFPVVVSDASMLMNAFLVDARAAQSMLDGTGFRVVELFPGKALLQLLAVDYKENDLGDYNEGAIIFPTVPSPSAIRALTVWTLSRIAEILGLLSSMKSAMGPSRF